MRTTRARRRRRGQALIETALALPIFLVLLFAGLDFNRFFYARTQVEGAAHEAGRALIVDALRNDDCTVLQRAQGISTGLPLLQLDPASRSSPLPQPAASDPSDNQALLYIAPAALATGSCPAPSSTIKRPAAATVTAVVSYGWVPLTPLIGLVQVNIRVIDTEPTQWP